MEASSLFLPPSVITNNDIIPLIPPPRAGKLCTSATADNPHSWDSQKPFGLMLCSPKCHVRPLGFPTSPPDPSPSPTASIAPVSIPQDTAGKSHHHPPEGLCSPYSRDVVAPRGRRGGGYPPASFWSSPHTLVLWFRNMGAGSIASHSSGDPDPVPPTPSMGAGKESKHPAAKPSSFPWTPACPVDTAHPLDASSPRGHPHPASINSNPCNSLCFDSLPLLAPALLISAPPAPKHLFQSLESGDLLEWLCPGLPPPPAAARTHSTHVPCGELGAIRPGDLEGARLGLIKPELKARARAQRGGIKSLGGEC